MEREQENGKVHARHYLPILSIPQLMKLFQQGWLKGLLDVIRRRGQPTDIAYIAIYVTAMFSVVLTPRTCSTMLYVDWGDLTPYAWLRAVFGFILWAFLPGMAIVRMLERERAFSPYERLILSYIISAFFYIWVYEIAVRMTGVWYVGLDITLVVSNALLLLAYIITTWVLCGHPGERISSRTSRSTSFDTCVIAISSFLIVLSAYFIAFSYHPLVIGDEWIFHGWMIRYYNGSVGWRDFCPTYQRGAHLACLLALTGLPPTNTYLLLRVLSFMPYLAIYLAMTVFFDPKRSKVPIVSFVLALSAGYGWAYFVYLRHAEQMEELAALTKADLVSYDIKYPFLLFPRILTEKVILILPAFFTLFYLTFRRSIPKSTRLPLIALVMATCYILHVHEAVLFAFFHAIYSLLDWMGGGRDRRGCLEVSMGLFIGMGLVAALDILSPRHVHILPDGLGFYTFLGTIVMCLFPAALFRIRPAGLRPEQAISWLKITSPAWFPLLFYVYALSLLIVFYFGSPPFQRYFIIPIYYYPVKLGVVGLLSLIWVLGMPEVKRMKGFLSLLLASLLSMAIMRGGATLLQIQTLMGLEFRTFTFVFFSLLPLASSELVDIMRKTRERFHGSAGILLPGLIMTLTLMAGIGSTLLSIELWRLRGVSFPDEDLHVAAELARKAGLTSYVLTLSEESLNILRYSGVARIVPTEWHHYYAFLGAKKPGTYLRLLHDGRIGYVFITPTDTAFLTPQGPFLGEITHYLPLVCGGNSSRGYGVPSMAPPRTSSDTALILPQEPPSAPVNLAFLTLSLANIHYTTVLPDDPALNNYTVLFVLDQSYLDIGRMLSLCQAGSVIVVLNWAGYGPLADYLAINATTVDEHVDGLVCGEREEELPVFSVTKLSFDEARTRPLAYFTSNGTAVTPYALMANIGEGEVLYLNVYPYLSLLNSTDENVRRRAFTRLPAFLDVLSDEIPLSHLNICEKSAYFHRYSIGDIRLEGDVCLTTSGLVLLKSIRASILSPVKRANEKLLGLNITGRTIISINSKEAILSPHPMGTSLYAKAELRDKCSFAFKLFEGSRLTLCFSDGIERFEGNEKGVEVVVEVETPTSLLIRSPHVRVDGTAEFECLYYPGARPVIFIQPRNDHVIARGSIRFRVLHADAELLLLSDLEVKGDMWIVEDILYYYPCLRIDWAKVLLSIENAVLLVFSGLIAYGIGVIKERDPRAKRSLPCRT